MSFAAVIERLQKLENPYPGLRPFETHESHLFFGRDQQVAELLRRLEHYNFVAVVGVSGSGKSSLVRAGLIPALERANLSEAGRRWRVVVTRPAGAPFERLTTDLANSRLDPSGIRESSHALISVARQLAPDESLLVVVDQFEELFRYKDLALVGEDARREKNVLAADAAEFVQLLLAASRHQPPVYVVLTMRSDYLGDCAEFRDLPETLNDCQYLVPRMTREQRKRAIEGPLGQTEIQPSLVQRLLNEAGDEPDQLPVLQHALMRTWSRWHKEDPDRTRRISLRDYEDIGGLNDALNQHADALLVGVRQDLTATIFKRLTAEHRGRERRNPATLADLWAVCGADTPEQQQEATAIVDRFRLGDATFLVPRDGRINSDTYIDITHESLLRQWKKLRDEWMPEEKASVKAFLDLAKRASNWKERKGELLFGLDLEAAVQWERERNRSPAWGKHYAGEGVLKDVLEYIQASEKHRRAQVVSRRVLRSAIGAAFAVLGALVFIRSYQAWTADEAASAANKAAWAARILSVRSVQDPLKRALLLAALGDRAGEEDLPIYQEAAAAAIPTSVLHFGDRSAVGAGFLQDARVGIALSDGSLWSWRTDGRGNHAQRSITSSQLTVATFSEDGRWIAAGLTNGEVSVGPLDGVSQMSPLPEVDHTSSRTVMSLAFSHDGRQLAAGYSDYSVRVWQLDTTSHQVLATGSHELPRVHTGPISSVAFDPTGTRIVTGSWDNSIRLWSLDDPRKPGLELGRDDEQVTTVVFSPDGTSVVSGCRGGAIRVWRIDRPGTSEAAEYRGHTAAINAAAFSPDGSELLTASDDRKAVLWMVRRAAVHPDAPRTLEMGSPIVMAHYASVILAVFDQNGTAVVTTSTDGTARLWRSELGEPRIVGRHDGRVESVAVDRDGKHVLSASDDRTARISNLDDPGDPIVLKGHDDWVRSAAFDPADSRKVLTGSEDGTLRLWEMTGSGTIRSTASHEDSNVFSVAFDKDGTRVVTALKEGGARIWRTQDLLPTESGSALDAGNESRILNIPHKDWVLGAAFNADGSRIATASRDGAVRLWAADGKKLVHEFVIPGRPVVFSAAFSPDNKWLVTASADGAARVWRVDREAISEDPNFILRHTKEVTKAIFSSRGAWIATVSSDGTARLWGAQDGREKMVLQHGAEAVRAISFDADDERVVTGTADGVLRVWRVTLPALTQYLRQATTACLASDARVQFLGESEDEARSQYERCEERYGRTEGSSATTPVQRGSDR